MRRQQRRHQYVDDDDYHPNSSSSAYKPLHRDGANGDVNDDVEDFLQMERLSRGKAQQPHRFENTIEAKVEIGDTLQALALRFHCTVADIKRLNKIDKENEIHARKVVKIPVTVHSVLLETLPAVHKSGNNSPKHPLHSAAGGEESETSSIMRNPLEDARVMLSEKLMVASVNAASSSSSNNNINNIILNSKVTSGSGSAAIYTDADPLRTSSDPGDTASSPLLFDDETYIHGGPRPIRGPALSAIDWSGSDCDMSWACLFIVILALCFVIPLIYVVYVAEHPHHHNTTAH